MSRTNNRSERGVALLIVITILVTMLLVAVPFALSMRQGQERTRSLEARGRAQFEASLLTEISKLFLNRTTADNEQRRRDKGEGGVEADPLVDNLGEITPTEANFRGPLAQEIAAQWALDPDMRGRAAYLESRGLGPLNDDRGSIWTVQIQDAQALVNPNGASPHLLGNLLGSALLSEELGTEAADVAVEHVATGIYGGMPSFPATDGLLRVGREVISYESFDGEVFRGCQRGLFQKTPLEDNAGALNHERGTPVIDYTAYKLATHLIARNPGQLTRFRNLEDLRDIASWGEGGVITAERLERLLPYLTVWSRRETSSEWLADQLIINQLPQSLDGGTPDEIQLRDHLDNPVGTTSYFNPGTLARITNGILTVYQSVDQIGESGGRRRDMYLTLAGPVTASREEISFPGGETMISAYAPYPININTASREVLYAVMANIQFWRSDSEENIVTPKLAWKLAGDIVEARKGTMKADSDTGRRTAGPFRNASDFGRFLQDKVRRSQITRDQFAALYTNALNPHSSRLRFGTAPWCYRTLDVYHIESRVALNNSAGEQIAEAGVREVVEIGSDRTATWTLDSQQDFEQRLAMGSGAKWVTTYPFAVAYKSRHVKHVQPALRPEKGYTYNVYPSAIRDKDLGDVRLEPARMDLQDAQVIEHFDHMQYADGHYFEYDGAYSRATADTWMKNGDKNIRPFSMSFWWRPYSDANWTVFDAGILPHQNRISLFVQNGVQGQELTFRVCAGNKWTQGAEVYVPLAQLDYQPGNWYHIHVSCVGEDPATMQMLVDGVDIGERRGLTATTGSISIDGAEIPVEDTAGFPIRGAVRIGTEIIEYDTLTDTSFRDCIRGARGTLAQEWPNNTPIHMVGYSMPITVPIMQGGMSLDERMSKFRAVRVSTMSGGEAAPDTVPLTIDGTDTPIILAGFSGERRNIELTTVGMWGIDDTECAEAFNSRGIALLGSPEPSAGTSSGDEKLGGWEVVYYEREGNNFTVERYIETTWQEAGEEYFLITENRTAMAEYPAFLVPISVLATGTGAGSEDDYLDPSKPEDEEWLLRYYPDGDASARVLIGSDLAGNEGQVEVIRYDSIDRERGGAGILFVRDRNINGVATHFFGTSQTLQPPGTPTDPGDPVPPVPDPDDPPPPVPPVDDGGGIPPPPDDGTPQDPTPGDGVPPGQRDPVDPAPDPDPAPAPPPDDPGGNPDPNDDGGDEPLPSPGPAGETGGGDNDDGGEGGEPTGDDPAGGDKDQDLGDGSGDAGEQNEEASPGDSVEPGGRETEGGEAPPPEEPTPDDSGGGGDLGDAGGPEEGGDAVIPDQPPPGLRDPADEESDADEDGNTEPTGDVWEPAGPGTARDLLQMRGVNNTEDLEHSGSGGGDENSLFLPCFRTYEGSRGAPIQRVGRNDVITVTSGQNGDDKVQIGVRWGDATSSWAALDEFIERRFDPDKEGALTRRNDMRGRARVMKFPCGELPDEMSKEIEFGQSTMSGSGLVRAFLDELYVWRQTPDTQLVVEDFEGVIEDRDEIRLVNAGTTQNIATIDGYDQECGVALVEGELVIYRGTRMESDRIIVLERCARGQFGTKRRFHPRGAPVRFVSDIPVSYLEGSMTTQSSTIPMARTAGWPREGLVRIVGDETVELVHYTRLSDEELSMPASIDADESTRDRGLFRGRFGTDATEHDSEDLVIFQPFRYWDRFAERRADDSDLFAGVHEHPETSFFEVGKKVRAGYWRGFSWSQNLLGRNTGAATVSDDNEDSEDASAFLDIWVLARFNSNVPWDSEKVVDLRRQTGLGGPRDLGKRMNDHLFLFDAPGGESIGNGRKGNPLLLESDTAEFRVYMVFKANSFDPMDLARSGTGAVDDPVMVNYWKQTPWLRSFTANFFSRTTTRYRATVR